MAVCVNTDYHQLGAGLLPAYQLLSSDILPFIVNLSTIMLDYSIIIKCVS